MPSRERPEWYYGRHPPACTCVNCSTGGGRPSRTSDPHRSDSGGCSPVAVGGLVVAVALGIVGVGIWLFVYGGVDYFAGRTASAPALTRSAETGAAPLATSAPTPTSTLPPVATAILRPVATATPVPTHTPLPTPSLTVAPTTAPTATLFLPTERQIVVNAFAECNGQYSGRDQRFREAAADSAIGDGRRTVADIRALVEKHCAAV